METNNTEDKRHKTALHIFAIVGFILLLIVGIWSTVQIVRLVPRLVGDDTKNIADATLEVLIHDTQVRSGTPFELGWDLNQEIEGDGVLSFAYECAPGARLTLGGEALPCNEAHTIADVTTPLVLTALASVATDVTMGVAVTYTNPDNENVRGSATLTITDGIPEDDVTTPSDATDAQTSVSTHQPTTSYIQVPLTSNPYGSPDLSVDSITLGVINAGGIFEARTYATQYERGAARFAVHNTGDKSSGVWRFHATLPTYNAYTYLSDPQASIAPRATAEITVTFDQLASGVRTFTVSIDPYNEIAERFEQNNSASALFTVTN